MAKYFGCYSIIFAVLCGCSQPHKTSTPNESFFVSIHKSGVKQFQYIMRLPKRKTSPLNSMGRAESPGKAPTGGQIESRTGKPTTAMLNIEKERKRKLERLKVQLNKQIKVTGFCRDGYIEIDQYSEAQQLVFNGRCNELASAADKLKYMNR